MEIIQEFLGSFNELTKQDWSEILILLGIASLLSFLIGWILRSFKVSSLRKLLATKDTEYKRLNNNYKDNLSLLTSKEEEEAIYNNRIKSLSDEVDSLKLKLSSNVKKEVSIVDVEQEEALITDADGDDVEGSVTKKRWLDRVRDVFSTNQSISGEAGLIEENSISTEEKLKATNNLVDRLLNANEKLEDENTSLKNKVVELENKPVEVKTIVEKPAETVVVNKSEAEKYTKSLTEARITGQDLLKRIQELEIYNGKIIKQLDEANTLKSGLQNQLQSNGDFKTKYTDLTAQFEKTEIKNNKLAAELQGLQSTAKQNTFEAELKNKTTLLSDCTREKTILQDKLTSLTKQIELKNKAEDQKLKEVELKQTAEKEKLAAEQKAADAKKLANQAAEAKRIAEEKARQEAEVKRLAAEKAKQEAETKAALELKAKQEAELKKAAEIKAKQEAETKAAVELKVKQEAELKKAAEIKARQAAEIQKQKATATPLDSSRDIMERIKSKAASINFNKIGKGDATQKDDLKQIKGIGEFVEKKLNALGIYNFRQVANLSGDDIDKVNDAIEFFPGRIKRDNWVGQANMLSKK